MAHDTRLLPVPLKTKGLVGGGVGLPQLDISLCVPPTAAPMAAATGTSAPQPWAGARAGLVVHVDRAQVIGAGQYATVCLGRLAAADGDGGGDAACAIKIPHEGNLDARELGLVEAAALWQAGSAPQTVGCYGLVDLSAGSRCTVQPWPAVAERALAGQGEWALVLEYCGGGSCWEWMSANRPAMNTELFFVWARQLAMALVALKAAGMAHMDIKGHNMLLGSDGSVRLADFTATKFSGQALAAVQLASPGFAPQKYPPYVDYGGTIPYSAPEALAPGAAAKTHTNDELHKMDIYSLGVTLYSLFVSGREPYATVKSAVEQMLLAARGAFWGWEERHCLSTLQSAAETAPSTPVDARPAAADAARLRSPPSPPAEAATPPRHALSRSASLGQAPPARRRTLKSRKATPKEFRRFLAGDLLPPNVEALLCAMVSPDPAQRPDAADVLRTLDTIEADIFEP
ncbi:hypothetical protein H4R21_005153 [Coemansia helicoidea]|uniref:Uncharacterized protein n=1 Tax=Coemansia helicoidea TaxID=1286919 RepID=A0ACC1KUR8_9FUNG|nr:hypothetical protein H4R21_005153 [Coemansia helicoidea]